MRRTLTRTSFNKEICVSRLDDGSIVVQVHQDLNDTYLTGEEVMDIVKDINLLTRD